MTLSSLRRGRDAGDKKERGRTRPLVADDQPQRPQDSNDIHEQAQKPPDLTVNLTPFLDAPTRPLNPATGRHSYSIDRSLSPSNRPRTSFQKRFSTLRFRHASDPALSTRFKEFAAKDPSIASPAEPQPPVETPTIITTSPTLKVESLPQTKKRKKQTFLGLTLRSKPITSDASDKTSPMLLVSQSTPVEHISFEDSTRLSTNSFRGRPSESHSAYSSAVESSTSGPSSVDNRAATSSAPASRTASAAAFFRMPNRKKKTQHLFPLPAKTSPSPSDDSAEPDITTLPRPSYQRTSQSATFATSNPSLRRHDSTTSAKSALSSPGVQPFPWRNMRSRSSTLNSSDRGDHPSTSQTFQLADSGRNSTASTLGRNSPAGFKSLSSKFRQSSEPQSPRRSSPGNTLVGTPRGTASPNNISREALVIPEREDGETPSKYLERLRQSVPKKAIAGILSKSADTFSHDVLRSFLRSFSFFEEPLDMSVRKLLWSIDLPSEAQQIDRVIHALAERYHECNPGIFKSADDAYFAAYSLIILHSDLFNKNNKHKMLREEYQRNTGGRGIPVDVLGYFYDNIQYTEFIQKLDEDEDNHRPKTAVRKTKKLKTKNLAVDAPGKLDPYDLILEEKLHILRPQLKDVMNLEDTYDYYGTLRQWDLRRLQRAFTRSGILQLISSRSRPEAFMLPATITNPQEASPGVVDIKITKVGLLWRKEAKRTRTRSPWQEWGALLTANQLFLCKNAGWVKSLVQQYDTHQKQGNGSVAVVFKPILEEFKPEGSIPITNAVALRDLSYKRHKNAFVLARSGGYEEIFLADNEAELNDWMAKVNYAATFKSANIAMRTFQQPTGRSKKSLEAPTAAVSVPKSKFGEPEEMSEAQRIVAARRLAIIRQLAHADEQIAARSEELEDNLRTARHLHVLAPILPKSREHVVLAAGRLAAKLKWLRFDLWRLRCIKDVLSQELEDEKKLLNGAPIDPEALTISPVTSQASISVSRMTLSKLPGSSNKSQVQSSNAPSEADDAGEALSDRGTGRMGNLSNVSTSSSAPYTLPALPSDPSPFGALATENFGESGAYVTHSRQNPSLSSVNEASLDVPISGESSAFVTPTQSIHEPEETPTSLAQIANGDSEKEPRSVFSSPESRSRRRRALQRTLRDSKEMRGHQRSRRGRDSISSANADDTASPHGNEKLPRSKGSFTVHGKKASVITFGSEWQNMSAEERLQQRKKAQQHEKAAADPMGLEDQSETDKDGIPTASEDESASYQNPRYSGLNGASFHVGEDGAILFYDFPDPLAEHSPIATHEYHGTSAAPTTAAEAFAVLSRLTPPASPNSRKQAVSPSKSEEVEPVGVVANYRNHEMAEDDDDSSLENVQR